MAIVKAKRWFWVGLGGAAALSPLAVVIACGETSASAAAPTTLTTDALAWQAGSTNAKLTWAGKVSVTGAEATNYAPVEYLSGAYADQASAAAATTWSTKLPESVAFIAAERHLWARALPAANQTVPPLYFDLTALSKVQSVPSDIDAEPALTELKTALDRVMISKASENIDVFYLNLPPIAAYLPLRFEAQINDGPWFSVSEFEDVTSEFLSTYQSKEPFAIKVRLQLTGAAAAFVFTQPTVKEVDLTPLASFLASEVRIVTNNFWVDTTSNHDHLLYKGSTYFSGVGKGNYGPIEYLTGDYPTRAAAEAATAWSTTLPTSTSFDVSKRFFWVRALPIPNAPSGVAPLYENITGSDAGEPSTLSRIRHVKANVNAAPTYAAVSLASLALSGTTPADVKLENQPDLASLPLALELQINGGAWFSASDFLAKFLAFAIGYTAGNAFSINARLALVDPLQRYVFTTPPVQPLDTANLQKLLDEAPAALNTNGLTLNLASSTHSSLFWNDRATSASWLTPTQVKIEYLMSAATSIADANAAPGWSGGVPITTSFLPSQRHLYVRLQLVEGAALLASTTRDVTTTSGLAGVKGNVNTATDYISNAKFDQFKLVSYRVPSGNATAPRTLIVTGTPQFTEAPVVTEISFDGGKTWVDLTASALVDAALADFVAKREDLSVTPSFKVRLALKKDTTWAVLREPLTATCTISDEFAQDLYDAAPEVKVDISSITANNWSPFELQDNQGVWPVKGAVESGSITQPEYDAHKAIWSDAPAKAKLASLTGVLKEAVVGFETVAFDKIKLQYFPFTPAAVAGIGDDFFQTMLINEQVFWTWGQTSEKWQWSITNADQPEQVVSMWARVVLSKRRKFVLQQPNAWDVTRTSRLAFSSGFFLKGYTAVTRAEFDEAVRYLKANVVLDESRTSGAKLAFKLLDPSKVPATLSSWKLNVQFTYGNTVMTKVNSFFVSYWPINFEIDYARDGFGSDHSLWTLKIQIFAANEKIAFSYDTDTKTYLAPSYFNVAKDTYDGSYGPGHLLFTIEDFIKKTTS